MRVKDEGRKIASEHNNIAECERNDSGDENSTFYAGTHYLSIGWPTKNRHEAEHSKTVAKLNMMRITNKQTHTVHV